MVYGARKIAIGILAFQSGVGLTISGFGAEVGVPASVVGTYNILSGGLRGIRGITQVFEGLYAKPYVNESPLDFSIELVAGVAPFGDSALDILGGLP